MAEAGRRVATRPERIKRAINALSKSREERVIALEQLREAGSSMPSPHWSQPLSSPR